MWVVRTFRSTTSFDLASSSFFSGSSASVLAAASSAFAGSSAVFAVSVDCHLRAVLWQMVGEDLRGDGVRDESGDFCAVRGAWDRFCTRFRCWRRSVWRNMMMNARCDEKEGVASE